MKFLLAITLGCSLLNSSLLLAQEQFHSPCACKNCKCTPQSHCGCYSSKGCRCGDHCPCGSHCGCDGHLLSNNLNFHHGKSDEHYMESSI